MFEKTGVMPSQLVAAVGPCIGVEAFEVGREVADQFVLAGFGMGVVHKPEWAKPHIDLAAVARAQLLALGLDESRIDIAGLCTVSNPEDFFSHRRDRGMTGRMVAVIGTKP
jgi:copper oxidase (laccase) domain-containing protein